MPVNRPTGHNVSHLPNNSKKIAIFRQILGSRGNIYGPIAMFSWLVQIFNDSLTITAWPDVACQRVNKESEKFQ